jgi:hypothetical protein
VQKVFDFFVCRFTMLKQDVPQREQLGRSPTKAFPPDVRFGSKGDMCDATRDVRFGPIADIMPITQSPRRR